jgi:hypothetical protein
MWFEEVIPCEEFNNPSTIVNVYNFYYFGSCEPKDEACLKTIPPHSVVSGVSTITVDGVTETVPVDTFVTT